MVLIAGAAIASGQVVPLPAAGFISQAEYLADADVHQRMHEARRRVEQRCRDAAGDAGRDGICAPCLRATRFSGASSGAAWASGQRCDCEDALPASSRWLLHAALDAGCLRPWSRLLLLGQDAPVQRRLRALAGEIRGLPEPPGDAGAAVADGWADLLIAAEILPRAPDPRALLARLRRAAAPSATLLASFPFHPDSPVSLPGRARGGIRAPYAIGWDILRHAAAAGWQDAAMLLIWNRELGYLGVANFLLRGVAH